jgi:hypothetical protein
LLKGDNDNAHFGVHLREIAKRRVTAQALCEVSLNPCDLQKS